MTKNELAERIADRVVEGVLARLSQRKAAIWGTYRLQFHCGFTFREATALVPYLHELGVSHLYASPFLRARPGSTHGYDVSNHNELDPSLGTDVDFQAFAESIKHEGLGQLVDFVPNHMSTSTDNAWWRDVLENGPSSPYAHFFDIDWKPVKAELLNKVLLPILGGPYGQVLESGELRLGHADGGFVIHYGDAELPIAPKSLLLILSRNLDQLKSSLEGNKEAFDEFQSILTTLERLPVDAVDAPEKIGELQREKDVIKRRLKRLESEVPAVASFIAQNVESFQGRPGDPASFNALDDLLNRQAYRVCNWRSASDEVNYRRFFDVNELAALSMELEEVFDATHRKLLDLLLSGAVFGVRLDHIDGLYAPNEYLWTLQRAFVAAVGRKVFEEEFVDKSGDSSSWDEVLPIFLERFARKQGLPGLSWIHSSQSKEGLPAKPPSPSAAGRSALPLYVLVEKILGAEEPLPLDWPVAGTTGYDFLGLVGGLLVEPEGLRVLKKLYARFTGESDNFSEIALGCKVLVLRSSLASELQMLAHRLNRISEQHRSTRDLTLNALRHALREILAAFPVYRTYPGAAGVSERDRRFIMQAIAQARRHNPTLDAGLFDFIKGVLLLEHPQGLSDSERRERETFAGRFQQVTSPLMAKGIEDTAFYRYCPLISLNEVGGHPTSASVSIEQFHTENLHRHVHHPESMLTLSTHDTKRSQDVRARLHVLTELASKWRKEVYRWSRLNHRLVREVDGLPAPSRNDEYLFYQTLVGFWPATRPEEATREHLVTRMQQYMQKATSEAKARTSWISPNAAYDEAVKEFVARSLDGRRGNRFYQGVVSFIADIADFGYLNGLTQVLLTLLSPGIPDTYQGQEIWDASLVDPDNRRPVDYAIRQELLRGLAGTFSASPEQRLSLARELGSHPSDARSKLLVTWQALHLRRDHHDVFSNGTYVPLTSAGPRADHVCAFAWILERPGNTPVWIVVVAPRWLAKLAAACTVSPFVPMGKDVWADTTIHLPSPRPPQLLNRFTGEALSLTSDTLPVAEALNVFPVGLFSSE